MNYIEKRIFRRVNAELVVNLEAEDQNLQTTTTNISCGGVFLKVDPQQLSEKEDLNVLIHLPNRLNPVKIAGKILRHENSKQGVAVQFNGLYNDNILEIEKFVKGKFN